jgi:hypothetical protein
VLPEPTAGFRSAGRRDRALEAFCAAVWERHEVRGHRPNPRMWPTSGAFRANMPAIAFDLIVGAWKIEEAAEDIPRERPSTGLMREHWLFGTGTPDTEPNGNAWQRRRHNATPTSELAEDLLDPPPPVERNWRDIYAVELANYPAILEDLERGVQGDGIERVLERAGLTSTERLVIRGMLAGDDAATIAADLGWRPQTVTMLLHNALARLQEARWASRHHRDVQSRKAALSDPPQPRVPPPARALATQKAGR